MIGLAASDVDEMRAKRFLISGLGLGSSVLCGFPPGRADAPATPESILHAIGLVAQH